MKRLSIKSNSLRKYDGISKYNKRMDYENKKGLKCNGFKNMTDNPNTKNSKQSLKD